MPVCPICKTKRKIALLKTVEKIKEETVEPHSEAEACLICCDEFGKFDVKTSIKPICCKNVWIHRSCLKKHALNAGITYKCPVCNNDDVFIIQSMNIGIHVPMR